MLFGVQTILNQSQYATVQFVDKGYVVENSILRTPKANIDTVIFFMV